MDAPVVVTLDLRSADLVRITARAAAALASTTTWDLTCTVHEGEELGSIVAVGTAVVPGALLVEKRRGDRDRSLWCPPHARGEVADVRTEGNARIVTIRVTRPVTIGDLIRLDGERTDVVSDVVDDLGGPDLEWPGVAGPHLVERIACAEDTLHARSIGPYSLVTQQPLATKPQFGGQRVEGPQLDAIEARGAIWTAHEMMTVKSDDVAGRMATFEQIVLGTPTAAVRSPRATEVLQHELRALGFDVDLSRDAVSIDLLDSNAIRALAPGVVKKPDTINYRSHAPEPGGLFCEAVFGTGDARARTFGRIDLAIPVLHPWLFDTARTLLDLDAARFEHILYGEQTLAGEPPTTHDTTGPLAIRAALADRAPTFFFDTWPVLPPDLRPIVPLEGGRFATSDLNDLYRRVINRNNRLARLLELKAPDVILISEARMLQRSVDALVQNGLRDDPVTGPNSRPLVSVAELLAGPKGRFQTNLLGKRVDYSAVAVVVPIPTLAPDRIRIPRSAARELFTPWLYAWLEARGHVTKIKEAKRIVQSDDPRAATALDEVATSYPVLLFPHEVTTPIKLASLDIELWDAPAFGLAPQAIAQLGLAPGASATLHVPIDPRAVAEVRALRDVPSIEPPASTPSGWIARAASAPTVTALAQVLVDAALRREIDPATDGPTRRILGRLAR